MLPNDKTLPWLKPNSLTYCQNITFGVGEFKINTRERGLWKTFSSCQCCRENLYGQALGVSLGEIECHCTGWRERNIESVSVSYGGN